jgi:hypothetical protein
MIEHHHGHWLTPAAGGVVVGSLVTMIVGFGWGGWVTRTGADRIAMDRTDSAVTAALVRVCLEKSRADPAAPRKLGELKALRSSYEQRQAVIRDGWATVGGGKANHDVAKACASRLLEVAVK